MTLDIPAPPGGTTVDLAATDGAAPMTVTIPADQLSAQFTYVAPAAGTATVTATLGASTSSATVTVVAAMAQLILNEILANEPGTYTNGEFVEIVNVGTAAADIGGFTLSDSASVRHTFAAGTTVDPGKAIVVYAGAAAIPGGIVAVAASSGALGLNNSGDTVTLRDAGGASVNSFMYPGTLAASDGGSMNRSPDLSPK